MKDVKSQLFIFIKPLLIALFVLFAATCLLWSWASIVTIRAEKEINAWEIDNTSFTHELAETFESRLLQSNKLNPLSANTYLLLGRLYEQVALNSEQNIQTAYLKKAETNYILALKKTPTWDFAWARLAHFYDISLSNKIIGNQKKLEEAIIKTLFIGPYERESQRIIIPLLFKYWNNLKTTSKIKQQAEKVFTHAIKYRHNRNLTLRSTEKYDKVDVLMPLLTSKKHIKILSIYQERLNKAKLNKQATKVE